MINSEREWDFMDNTYDEHSSMVQSYELLTGKISFEELLERDYQVEVIFNPTKPVVVMEDDVYDLLMEYFVGIEEYDVAAELRDQKKLNFYYSFSSRPLTYNSETKQDR